MLLAVDIGNTNISFGIFCGKRVIKKFNLATENYRWQDLRQNLNKFKIEDAIICSVVPEKSFAINRDLKKMLGRQAHNIGRDIKVPLDNLYRDPEQVGPDRLVNAYAAVTLYGAPLVAVDFGTAITFDVVSKKGQYLGGMILPGMRISLDVLHQRTALLPKAELGCPREFIGRDTKGSILSGIVYGFAGIVDDLAEKIKKKIGSAAVVVGTGGDIGLISRYCRKIDKIDRDLTLKGLNLIYLTF